MLSIIKKFSLLSLRVVLIFLYFSTSLTLYSQNKQIEKVTVQRIKVHGKGLEGDSADRYVSVYLPAGYKNNPNRRYLVVYFLHSYTHDDAKWYGFKKHWISLPKILDSVFSTGTLNEMIVVTPDTYRRYQGSMYSNSITTGNWEDFVAKELVSFVDSHYRTISQAASRGLAGHSMGGYGAMRIGEKHPEIFSSIYLLSPCCLRPNFNTPQKPEAISKIEAIKSFAEFEKLIS